MHIYIHTPCTSASLTLNSLTIAPKEIQVKYIYNEKDII
jgi:hypothetical protein